LLVQHYLATQAKANHVLMHSTNTRVYVLHVFPSIGELRRRIDAGITPLRARELQARFPKVKVDEDRIFINDGPIWTSAGMSSGIDLALALSKATWVRN